MVVAAGVMVVVDGATVSGVGTEASVTAVGNSQRVVNAWPAVAANCKVEVARTGGVIRVAPAST